MSWKDKNLCLSITEIDMKRLKVNIGGFLFLASRLWLEGDYLPEGGNGVRRRLQTPSDQTHLPTIDAFGLKMRGEILESEEAFKLVKETCYAVMDALPEKMPYEEYREILRGLTKSAFPKNGNGGNVEHVIHWGLFDGKGMDIKNEGPWNDSKSVVYKNGISRERINETLERHRPYITRDLANYL